jgi:hypothetical protein
MKQYVLNLYNFLKAKAGLERVTKYECNIHHCELHCAVINGNVTQQVSISALWYNTDMKGEN